VPAGALARRVPGQAPEEVPMVSSSPKDPLKPPRSVATVQRGEDIWRASNNCIYGGWAEELADPRGVGPQGVEAPPRLRPNPSRRLQALAQVLPIDLDADGPPTRQDGDHAR
jgi:hypothetical protein